MVWLADYEAWGNTAKVVYTPIELKGITVSKDELQPIRFQGQTIDQETGLHYNRFRYFDPDVGMFVSRDPIGLLGGNNVFQYAPNPTGWVDPWGLAKLWGKGTEYPNFASWFDSSTAEQVKAAMSDKASYEDLKRALRGSKGECMNGFPFPWQIRHVN